MADILAIIRQGQEERARKERMRGLMQEQMPTGQERRAWLDRNLGRAGGQMDRFLGPTGIPDKLRALAQGLAYTDAGDMAEGAQASRDMWNNPTLGNALRLGTAGAAMAIPMVGAKMANDGVDIAGDAWRGLTDDARAFKASESGAVGPGIKAYHGSPHDFDKFSMDKIGTGEGAQAYGHGLYFADSEGVARSYRDNLSGGVKSQLRPSQTLDVTKWADEARVLFPDDPKRQAAFHFLNQMSGKESAVSYADDMINGPFAKNTGGKFTYPDSSGAEVNFTVDEVAALADEFYSPGHMYEVNINANPDDFLDWDAPLREQPSVARAMGYSQRTEADINAEAETLFNRYGSYSDMPPAAQSRIDALSGELDKTVPDVAGADYYRGAINDDVGRVLTRMEMGNQTARAAELRDAGIPGIKYLDQVSRAAGEGSRNYVVFDENLVSIVRKYGVAGAAAMLGVNVSDIQSRIDKVPEQRDSRSNLWRGLQ